MIKYGSNNIGKIFFGSNQIGKAYFGSNLVFGGGSPTPPTPTTTVAYIRNTNLTEYIDTGITVDNTVKVIVWARNFNPSCGFLFGSREAFAVNNFGLGSHSGVNTGRIRVDFAQTGNTFADDQFANLSHYHKYELYDGVAKVDDVTIATATTGTFSNNKNIYLFGTNNNGTLIPSSSPIDICACKIYKNGTLVRNFTAVSGGMYDAVSGTTFTNAGSGSFTYGTFNLDAYTPLEYVECNGEQSFYSNVKGSNTLPFIAAYMPLTTTNVWPYLFGAQTSSTSKRYGLAFGYTDNIYKRVYFLLGDTMAYYNSSTSFINQKYIATKGSSNVFYLYRNNQQVTTQTVSSGTYTTDGYISIGDVQNYGGSTPTGSYVGRVYYISLGVQRSFVPAKVSGVAGMYDTYNDEFYPSLTGTAFVAGPQRATQTHFFRNKKISIIGDSISTYNADGYKYDSYSMYYPSGDVDSVDKTYWKMLMDYENATLEVNLSYSGSRTTNTDSGKPSLCDRTSLIGNCDIVIIAMGTNDSNGSVALGNYSYDTDTASLSEATFRDAYIKGIKQIQASKPNVTIVCVILSMKEAYAQSIREIAGHYNLKVVERIDYPFTVQVHPTASGMSLIFNEFLYI